MCVAFFLISFPAGIFICYGLEFRLVCLQLARCSLHGYHAGGHAKGQKSGFGSPFSPCNAAYKPLLFFPARCGGYVSRRVYHLIRRDALYYIYVLCVCACVQSSLTRFPIKKISFIILNIPRGTDDLPDVPGLRICNNIYLNCSRRSAISDGRRIRRLTCTHARLHAHVRILLLLAEELRNTYVVLLYRVCYILFYHRYIIYLFLLY